MFKSFLDFFLELRLALSFLTLLPVAPKKILAKKQIASAVAFFTLVAYLFFALSLLIIKVFDNPFVIAIFVLLAHSLLSGALHLDALADTHDGLAVSDRPVEKIKEVIKDSRAGAFAVIAVVLTLLAQFVFISQSDLQTFSQQFLLCLVPVLSRFFMVLELVFFVNAKKLDTNSSLKTFLGFSKPYVFFVNLVSLLFLLVLSGFNYQDFYLFFIAAFIFSFLFYRFLFYKLKMQNGDTVGCGLVINETFLYFLIMLIKPC